jgi:general secretion pathway protein G
VTCPKCGYSLSDLDRTCPRCGAEPGQSDATSPEVAERMAWEEQCIGYIVAHTGVSLESARNALSATGWDLASALTRVRGGVPLVQSLAERKKQDTRIVVWIVGGVLALFLLLCLGYAGLVGLFVRQLANEEGGPSGARGGSLSSRHVESARESKTGAEIRVLEMAVSQYQIHCEEPPKRLQDLVTKPADPKQAARWKGPYFQHGVPKDAWDHDYVYRSPGTHGDDFEIASAGRDGQPGTDDDINSWDLPHAND